MDQTWIILRPSQRRPQHYHMHFKTRLQVYLSFWMDAIYRLLPQVDKVVVPEISVP